MAKLLLNAAHGQVMQASHAIDDRVTSACPVPGDAGSIGVAGFASSSTAH